MAELFPAFIEARDPPTWSIIRLHQMNMSFGHLRFAHHKSITV
jgi:hypothetical protein